MSKRLTLRNVQDRGHSGLARVLTMLVLMLFVSTGAWAQEWISGITNGNFSGDDVSSFCKKEYPSTDVVPVVIGANVGKNGTPGIVVKSGDDTANPDAQIWDTQFWIVLSEEIPAGSTIRVQFDYKASKAAKGSTEFHADPASYLTWQAIGDVNFTTEWKTFNGEFTVPNDADGMKSIAFKLQEEKSATDYYFDNFSVSYKKSEWTNIVANSDMEGKDVSCFYVHEQGKKGIYLARITDGIGKDGSRAIKVQSSDNEANSWDTQFHTRLPYVLPKGTTYRLSFDYKSDKAGVRVSNDEDYSFGFQVANEPNQYIWWTLGGWPAPYIETIEDNVNKWQHYSKVFAVPAECDGVSKADDNDWLRQFRTIYVNLAGNKVATEFIFDNVKVEILSNVVSTLTAEPVTDPELMIPYYDDEAVAVGKLQAAVETYNAIDSPTADDKATLKAAIDQFKADNADIEKDETAKVATDGWKKFNGEAAGVCSTDFAPAIDTYDGRKNVNLAECFEWDGNRTGTIIYQDITGLTNGQYKVGFYGNAFSTTQRDHFECIMEDGATDAAYVFANEKQQFITARLATSTTENNFRQFDVEVTDGTIKLGMGKAYGKSTNWHTMQIYQLTWFATAKQAYAAYQTELAALLADAKTLAADENKTEGRNDFNTAIANAEEATTTKADWYNNTEIEAIIADLKTAIANFKKANWYINFAAGQYYLIDLTTNKMMAAGHDWGTRAIVNEMGLDLTLTPNSETHTVTIDSRVFNGDTKHFLGSDLYMDGSAYGWALEYQGFGFYILNPASEKYISVDANDNLELSSTPREWIIVTADGVMEQLLADMDNATEENPVDATRLIKANNFNRNDARNAEAWTVVQELTGEGHTTNLSGGEDNNNGSVGNNCADAYCTPFSFTQTITNAPAGTYRLTAQGFYRQEDYESENPATPQFFANGVEQAVPVWTGSVNSMTEAAQSFSAGKYTIDPIEFTVGDDGKMEIGISGTASKQWVCFDNFRLTYLGAAAEEPGHVRLAAGTADADNWKAKAGDATEFGDLPLEGVAEGTTVTLKYNGTKKVIGVKAEKKAAPKLLEFEPMGVKFYYYEGETWGEAIQNHPENAANGWYIEEFGITVMYKGRALCDSAHDDDITKDTKVNPNGGYLWGPES